MTQETFAEMARRHRADDMLVTNTFKTVDGQSRSIGCFCHDHGLKPNDFSGLAKITKYPESAHHLQEVIFEGLPEAERADWHVAFAEKAETVTDWQAVIDKTVLASLRIAELHDTSTGKVASAVIDLYERQLSGDNPSEAEWNAADAAAWAAAAAAADAADAAAWAARTAARAAAAATDAAAWAAAAAAWGAAGGAAGGAADAAAAEAAAWVQIRDVFLNA